MIKMTNVLLRSAALLSVAALAACGGGATAVVPVAVSTAPASAGSLSSAAITSVQRSVTSTQPGVMTYPDNSASLAALSAPATVAAAAGRAPGGTADSIATQLYRDYVSSRGPMGATRADTAPGRVVYVLRNAFSTPLVVGNQTFLSGAWYRVIDAATGDVLSSEVSGTTAATLAVTNK